MNPQTLYWALLSVMVASFLTGEILGFLNASSRRTDIDPRVAGFYDADKYRRSLSYQNDRYRFSLVSGAFSFALTIAVVASGTFGWLDSSLSAWLGDAKIRALVFFAIVFVASDLMSIPFDLYSTFVIEAKYGFNRTTKATFAADRLKGYILSAVLGGGVLFLFLVLIEALGGLFWIVFALCALVITLFLNMFYASLIVPLFNKLTPLGDGDLKTAVSAYADSQGLKLSGIFVMDGSKRSTKANAFFSGLGPVKKIVLFDTLIRNHPVREVVAVLAHETGHLKLGHIPRMFALSAVQTTLVTWVFSLFLGNGDMSIALGGTGYGVHLNLVASGILFAPIAGLTGLAAVVMSRRHEREADAFAARTCPAVDLSTALIRLSADSLSDLYPHPAYVFFNYSHPPLLERVKKLESFR